MAQCVLTKRTNRKSKTFDWLIKPGARRRKTSSTWEEYKQLKGLILAQNERWRRGLGMQVVRYV